MTDKGVLIAKAQLMADNPSLPPDEQVERLLAFDERGLATVQDMAALLREMHQEMLALVQRIRYLEPLAWTDPLTGLANRRGFEEELHREEARARRYGAPAAVLLLDVRGLKAINDQFGHSIGDMLLRGVGSAIRSSARESDVVARLGGDEFAALLPGADVKGGELFLMRLRATARFVQLPNAGAVPVHLAAGVATRDEAGSLQGALELADQRLIADKHSDPGPPSPT